MKTNDLTKQTYGLSSKQLQENCKGFEGDYKQEFTTPNAVVKDLYNDFKDMDSEKRKELFEKNGLGGVYMEKAAEILSDKKMLFKVFSVYLPKINGIYCTKYITLSIKDGETKTSKDAPKETFFDIQIIKKEGFTGKNIIREHDSDMYEFGTRSEDGLNATKYVFVPKKFGYDKKEVLKALNVYLRKFCPNLQEIDEKSKDINKLREIDTPVYTQETTKKEETLNAADALNFAVEQIKADKTKQKKVGIYEFVCVRLKDNEKVMSFSHKEIKTLGVINLATNGLKQYIKIA